MRWTWDWWSWEMGCIEQQARGDAGGLRRQGGSVEVRWMEDG